jgi:hypothetical protein
MTNTNTGEKVLAFLSRDMAGGRDSECPYFIHPSWQSRGVDIKRVGKIPNPFDLFGF